MKEKGKLFLGILLGMLASGSLFAISLSFIMDNLSFLMGFVLCLLLCLSGLLLWVLWGNEWLMLRRKEEGAGRGGVIRILRIILPVLAGYLIGFLLSGQEWAYQSQIQSQKLQLTQQSELIKSIRNENLMNVMTNVLNKIDEELKNNSKRTLSEETIARVAAMANSFEPYQNWEGDSLASRKLSPERGQLLLALVNMGMDSSSFDKIKRQVSFAGADLEEADLRGVDLSGIDLTGCCLRKSDMRNSNLRNAQLNRSDLWGAKLRKADLRNVRLKRSDLRWAEMGDANMKAANLNGSNLRNAKMNGIDMRGGRMRIADLSHAFLRGANLTDVDLYLSKMYRANLSGVDLSDAFLWRTKFIETNLNNANLSNVNLTYATFKAVELSQLKVESAGWFEKIVEKKIDGAAEIQKAYQLVPDKNEEGVYRLIKLKE